MKKAPFGEPMQLGAGRPAKALIGIFTLFIVALTWAAPTQRIQYERHEAIQAAIDQNVNRAIVLEQYVSRTLEAADITTLHVAEQYQGSERAALEGRPGRPAIIRGAVAQNPTFLGISIANARGDIVASTRGTRAGPQNVREHDGFRAHLAGDTGRLFVSKPAFSPVVGRDVIWLTRRLNNPDGSFAGAVAINISPEQFTAFYEDISVQPTDVISVIGLDGVTRARRTGAKVSSGEDLSGKLVMRMQQRDPNGTYLGPSALDGLVRYFSHRRLKGYPLFATYGVLQESVLEPVEKRARLFILVASLVTAITAAFAVVLIMLLGRRERQAAEVAIAKRRLEEAQRIGQIGDWEYDFATGSIHWSPQLFRMYERDPSKGHPLLSDFESYLDDQSRTIAADAAARAIETGEPQSYEVTARLASGAESHRLVSAIPIYDADGKAVGLRGTDQDISARKKLDRLEAEVTHLSRLEAMNAMAATLAHELNQPLTAASNYLRGSSRMLKSADADLKQVAEGMDAAQQQVLFAGEIIRRVRSMVSRERKHTPSASVSRIVDDAIALALAGDLRDVTIDKEIGANALFIQADRVQIQQVLLNLIRNARDAAANVEHPRIVIRSRRADAGHVLVSVEDNGPGFTEHGAPPFSPFASGTETGLGLGLSISRTIVESHGGRIWVENQPDSGARVSFTVPVSNPRASTKQSHAAA